jgi:hypothetical protein
MSDRPATECEVDEMKIVATPEMIEAATDVVARHATEMIMHPSVELYKEIAEEILKLAFR